MMVPAQRYHPKCAGTGIKVGFGLKTDNDTGAGVTSPLLQNDTGNPAPDGPDG